MPLARTEARWLRAVLFGVLAELATIVTIVFIVTIHSVATGGPMMDMTSRFAKVCGATVGIVGGATFVYLFSRWIGRFLSTRFVAHGLVVAIAATAFHLLSSRGAGDGIGVLQYSADTLKIVAGALGGWMSAREMGTT